jgi:hypothetical protein
MITLARRLMPSLIVLLLPGLVSAQSASEPSASAPASMAALQNQMRLARETELAALPAVDVAHLTDLLQLSVDDAGHLALRTTLRPPAGRVRVRIGDTPSLASLAITGDPADGQPYEPRVFQLILDDYNDPTAAIDQTTVILGPGSIQIARDRDEGQGLVRVELIQSGIYLGEGRDERVRLYITRTNDADATQDVAQSLPAASYAALRHRHAGPVALYVHPIFRRLRQGEQVLSVDGEAAWQVLGDRYELAAGASEQVQELLAKLDADDAGVRTGAASSLQAMGQPAAIVLQRLDRSRLSPEQRSQVDNILAELAPLPSDEAAALAKDPQFLVEILGASDPALRAAALAQLQAALGHAVSFDLTATNEKRQQTLALLRSQLALPTTRPVGGQ